MNIPNDGSGQRLQPFLHTNQEGLWKHYGSNYYDYEPIYRRLVTPKTIQSIKSHFLKIYGKYPTETDIRYALDNAYYTDPPYDAFLPYVSYRKSAAQDRAYEMRKVQNYIEATIQSLDRNMKRYVYQHDAYLRDIKQPTGYAALPKSISDSGPHNILLHRNPYHFDPQALLRN